MTRRKRQPTAERYREQLAMAADRIIELKTTIDTTKWLMGWDRPPVVRTPWYRRLFRKTDKQTAAEQAALERV